MLIELQPILELYLALQLLMMVVVVIVVSRWN